MEAIVSVAIVAIVGALVLAAVLFLTARAVPYLLSRRGGDLPPARGDVEDAVRQLHRSDMHRWHVLGFLSRWGR